jgi:MFS family permease
MIGSLFLSGMLLLVFWLAKSFVVILVLAFVMAVISEAFRPASLASITELVAPAQRKTAFSVNRLAINLGMSIGPAVGGFLIIFSYPLLFIVDGATAIAAGLVLLLAPWHPVEPNHREKPGQPKESTDIHFEEPPSSVWKDRRLFYFLLAIIPVIVVFFQHNSSMPLFLVGDLHLAESTYGLLFTINTGLIILLEVPLNIAMAHWPHRRALSFGAVLSGLGFGAMGLVTGVAGVALTVVIWSFGEMILFPAAANYMADIAVPERRGMYMGMFQMTFSLSFSLSGWAGTTVLQHFGATVLWASTFVAGCASALMLWNMRR